MKLNYNYALLCYHERVKYLGQFTNKLDYCPQLCCVEKKAFAAEMDFLLNVTKEKHK